MVCFSRQLCKWFCTKKTLMIDLSKEIGQRISKKFGCRVDDVS